MTSDVEHIDPDMPDKDPDDVVQDEDDDDEDMSTHIDMDTEFMEEGELIQSDDETPVMGDDE